MPTGPTAGCLVVVGLLLIPWLLAPSVNQARREAGRRAGLPDRAPPARVAAPALEFNVGDTVVLDRPGGAGHTHVSVDETTFLTMRSIDGDVKKLPTFSRLTEEERILRIHNGTRAKILELGDHCYRVEMLDGYRARQSGWVESRYVRQPLPSDQAPPTAPPVESET